MILIITNRRGRKCLDNFLGDANEKKNITEINSKFVLRKKQHTRMKSKTIGCKQHFGTELFSALIISANGTSQNSKLYTKIIALLLSLIEPHTHV